jgi:hypothetical protein
LTPQNPRRSIASASAPFRRLKKNRRKEAPTRGGVIHEPILRCASRAFAIAIAASLAGLFTASPADARITRIEINDRDRDDDDDDDD